jgi:predicted enzyme related to lactoylglutathione lyase
MSRRFDHVDLRVRNLAEVRPFYEGLLPAIGFTQEASVPGWLTYEAEGSDGATEFFGVTESPSHVANECRVAFWMNRREEVDRLATIVRQAGARNIEGPFYEDPQYYAVFFEDPSGNRLEICYRTSR